MVAMTHRSQRFSFSVRSADVDRNVFNCPRLPSSRRSSYSKPGKNPQNQKRCLLLPIEIQDFELSPSPMSPSQKTVRFDPWMLVRETISREEMTRQEKNDCWFHRNDYNRIKERNLRQIEQANVDRASRRNCHRRNSEIDEEERDEDCIRGLERHLEFELDRRDSIREEALDWVLGEQEVKWLQQQEKGGDDSDPEIQWLRQQDGYIVDDATIAHGYFTITASCRYRAVTMALEDRISASAC